MRANPRVSLAELTLDPEDWDELQSLGHRMLGDIFHHLKTLREQPAWQPVPGEVTIALDEPVPYQPSALEAVYQEFLHRILPYTNGNRHPRAWAGVRGTGTPLAMLAEMLASGMNPHAGGGDQSSTLVETQTLRWMSELLEMPKGSSGLLTSGGTMANLLGLTVARNTRAGYPIRELGLQGDRPRLLVYCSTETHFWIQKAMELLGLGTASLRIIPVNQAFEIDLSELDACIQNDLAQGLRPIAVVANCGTVNTGAIDDLDQVADLCAERKLWFHVDGSFGALLKLSPEYRHLVKGLERADSLAFDMHKWMYLPIGIGCLLVRDAAAHTGAFATPANYLERSDRGMMAGGLEFADKGIELTRSFKALKLWMSLKTHGVNAYAAMIEQNIAQCAHLERIIGEQPELRMAAPRPINVVCFRYVPSGPARTEEELNAINRELVMRLQESGLYVVSGTTLGSRYVLHIANTNQRSRLEDFDSLAADCVRIGREISGEY